MTAFVSRRRNAVRCLAALTISLAALTACGSGDDDGQSAANATAATSATPTPAADTSSPSPAGTNAGTNDGTNDGAGDEQVTATESAAPASPSASASASAPADTSASPSAAPGEAPWAGSKQFVQIEKARTSDGQTYLSVRPAQKKAEVTSHFETWVIIPGKGAYTEVPVADDVQVRLAAPLVSRQEMRQDTSYSGAEFVRRLGALPPAERAGVGYDLSFDGEGRVIRVKSLYRS
ncbi:hypothetical protein ACX6XY_29010 [Streptomyces sp. O3]